MKQNVISTLSLVLALGNIINLNAQNLDKHKWKERVVLIQTSVELDEIYQAQCNAFEGGVEAFKERKLVVYYIVGDKFKVDDYNNSALSNQEWQNVLELKDDRLQKKGHFQLTLIGLDGNIKLSQSEVLTQKALFQIIDSMPMRRTEIKNQKP